MKTRSLPAIGVAAILILGLSACAPEEEELVPADNPAVTEPVEALNTATPSNAAQAAAPTASAAASMSPSERFDVTEEEYLGLVESYRINAALDTEPKELAASVVDVLQLYVNNGLDTSSLNTHENWVDPVGEVQSGKGSWLNTLHTEALSEALAPGEENPTWLEWARSKKGITTGLYIVSSGNADPGYNSFFEYSFTTWNPTSATDGSSGYGIVGTLTTTSNLDENPSIQNHSRLPVTGEAEKFNIVVSNTGDSFRLDTVES